MEYSIQHIGAALREARLKNQLSQHTLSEKTGIPQSHISKIENGKVDLQISSLIQLLRVLNFELMLVPRALIPTVEAILSQTNSGSTKQMPKYRLDQEEEIDDD